MVIMRRRPGVGFLVLVLIASMSGCGRGRDPWGLQDLGSTCATDAEFCILVTGTAPETGNYRIVEVEETSTEVRITTDPSRNGSNDSGVGLEIGLDSPLGGRAVFINGIRAE